MKTIYFSFLAFLMLACTPGAEDSSNKHSSKIRDSIDLKRIDTHIHLYDTRREVVEFPNPKHKQIYFPHFEPEFKATAQLAGVHYGIVVEASTQREDNFWLMRHIDTSASLLGFIANLDPRDPNFIADIDSLSNYEKFRGIRIRPRKPIDLADLSIHNQFIELEKRALVLELEFNHIDIEEKTVVAIAEKFPEMNIIINHLAAGKIRDGVVQPAGFEQKLQLLASAPNVYCKISALYAASGLSPAPTNEAFYRPLIDPVVDAFGAERVLFGSNWTLSELRGKYSDMIQMYDEYLEYRTDLPLENLFFNNVVKAYGIEQRGIHSN